MRVQKSGGSTARRGVTSSSWTPSLLEEEAQLKKKKTSLLEKKVWSCDPMGLKTKNYYAGKASSNLTQS
jgi:hypothetical protein